MKLRFLSILIVAFLVAACAVGPQKPVNDPLKPVSAVVILMCNQPAGVLFVRADGTAYSYSAQEAEADPAVANKVNQDLTALPPAARHFVSLTNSACGDDT